MVLLSVLCVLICNYFCLLVFTVAMGMPSGPPVRPLFQVILAHRRYLFSFRTHWFLFPAVYDELIGMLWYAEALRR
ncbi:hypothetical protein EDB89DRAFT_1950740 [Lactarius sanguifluus]|nr:hypothetical protein EDB89DRAFT_1950740 [Lactarius sanguifluus]